MRKLKATWEMCEEEFQLRDIRNLLEMMLREEDAHWGEVRCKEDMKRQLDYLMGVDNEVS